MELVIAIVQILPIVVPALATVIVSIWGAYKQIKMRQYAEAFELTEKALAGIITGIEMIPMDPEQKKKVKAQLQRIAHELDTEGPKVAGMIKDLEMLMKDLGVTSSDDQIETAFRAAEVVTAYKQKKDKERK